MVDLDDKKRTIINGLNFCQVERIIHLIHDKADITWGSHWWNGANPSFNIKLIIKRICAIELNCDVIILFVDIIPAVNIIPLPIAWIKKYFTPACVSWNCLSDEINGIKDRRFNSIPIQRKSQFELEIAIKEPIINVDRNKNDDGVIKMREELNLPDRELEALVLP